MISEELQRFANLWKASVRNGGRVNGVNSVLHPIIRAIFPGAFAAQHGEKTDTTSTAQFARKHGALIMNLFQNQGRAILGLGLSHEQIDELTTILDKQGIDSEQALKDSALCIRFLYPDLTRDDPNQMKKFGSKLQHLITQGTLGPEIVGLLAGM